jgi:methylenetetrahydrofolate--tRNA-(uracil-5-)-methyltransferase
LELQARPGLYLAGQIAGVEGYVESAALGGLVGVHASRAAHGLPFAGPPPETAHGALVSHLMNARAKKFQPMNANYGLFPPLDLSAEASDEVVAAGQQPEIHAPGQRRGRKKLPKRERYARLAERALTSLEGYATRIAPGQS